MIQALKKPTGFNEFIDSYPENSEIRYELHRGVIVAMPEPRGKHSDVGGFLALEIGISIRHSKLNYFVPKECVVKFSEDTAYKPDVIVLDRTAMQSEPLWEKSSTIEQGASIPLIVEVISSNWRDDYFRKFADYEAMGIREYWTVDYAGLGGRRFIGNPKRPTLSVCELMDGEYEIRQYRGNDRILSPTFPELQLTAEQVFQAAI